MQKQFTLEQGNGHKIIDGSAVAAILPISEERRAKQGWDARFVAQVVTINGDGGLDTRSVAELVKEFRKTGIALGYIMETNEAVNSAAIKSVRTFTSSDNAPVKYFNAVATLVSGRTQWFAATPEQIVQAKPGATPAP